MSIVLQFAVEQNMSFDAANCLSKRRMQIYQVVNTSKKTKFNNVLYISTMHHVHFKCLTLNIDVACPCELNDH